MKNTKNIKRTHVTEPEFNYIKDLEQRGFKASRISAQTGRSLWTLDFISKSSSYTDYRAKVELDGIKHKAKKAKLVQAVMQEDMFVENAKKVQEAIREEEKAREFIPNIEDAYINGSILKELRQIRGILGDISKKLNAENKQTIGDIRPYSVTA